MQHDVRTNGGVRALPTTSALTPDLRDRFTALHRLVGNTPLLAIDIRYRAEHRRIYAKHESLSFTGSVKDRMALFVLERAYQSGAIRPGDRIAEATSGNTGISFAALGRALGHPVTIFMPDWMSEERVALIASFGADVVRVSREQGGFQGSIDRADAQGAVILGGPARSQNAPFLRGNLLESNLSLSSAFNIDPFTLKVSTECGY